MGRRKKNATADPPKPCGNPGIWHGARKDFLLGWLSAFFDWGHSQRKKFLEEVLEAYLELFPYHFADGPPELSPDATDEELAAAEEAARKRARIEAAAQIKSWFKNQGTKANAVKKKPYNNFLTKNLLNAAAMQKPRHTQLTKMWMKQPENRPRVNAEFEQKWPTANLPSTHEVSYRVKVARELFEAESQQVKDRIRQLVEEEHQRRIAAYEKLADGDEELTPETIELFRENLAALLEPLLEEVLRLCNLTTGSILLARPPSRPGQKMEFLSYHVGRTVASEGSLKLPDFEPEVYADIFIRHFMRFAVRTTDEGAALNREQEAANRSRAAFMQPGAPQQRQEVDNNTSERQPGPSRSRRRSRHKRTRRTRNIDDAELSGDETQESGPEGSGSGSDDDSEEEVPLATLFNTAAASSNRASTSSIPTDDYGIPLRDAQERTFPAELREHLSRMSADNRSRTLADLDKCSQYEFDRHCQIARTRLAVRRELEQSGLLHRGDPFYGDVTPKKVVPNAEDRPPSPGTPTRARRTNRDEDHPHGRNGGGNEGGDQNAIDEDDVDEHDVDEHGVDQDDVGQGDVDETNVDQDEVDQDEVDKTDVDKNHADEDDVEENGADQDDVDEDDVDENGACEGGVSKCSIGKDNGNKEDEGGGGDEEDDEEESDGDGDKEQQRDDELPPEVLAALERAASPSALAPPRRRLASTPTPPPSQEPERANVRNANKEPTQSDKSATDEEVGAPSTRGGADTLIRERTNRRSVGSVSANAGISPRTAAAAEEGAGERRQQGEDVVMHDVDGHSETAQRLGGGGGGEGGGEGAAAGHAEGGTAHQADQGSPEGPASTRKRRRGSGEASGKGREGAGHRGGQGGGFKPRAVSVFAADRSGWEDWFGLAVDNLALEGADDSTRAVWDELLCAWWEIERRRGYKSKDLLPHSSRRPPAIGEWIKRARVPSYAPKPGKKQPIQDFVEDWAAAMWAWWSDINPPWRKREKDGTVAGRQRGDWTSLDCGGPNSHLNVLKGLKWWFDMEGKPEGSALWLKLVKDVQWVLASVLKGQRDAQELPERPTKRKKA